MTTTAAAALTFVLDHLNHPDPQLRALFHLIYGPDLPRYEMLAAMEALDAAMAELERVSWAPTPAQTTP